MGPLSPKHQSENEFRWPLGPGEAQKVQPRVEKQLKRGNLASRKCSDSENAQTLRFAFLRQNLRFALCDLKTLAIFAFFGDAKPPGVNNCQFWLVFYSALDLLHTRGFRNSPGGVQADCFCSARGETTGETPRFWPKKGHLPRLGCIAMEMAIRFNSQVPTLQCLSKKSTKIPVLDQRPSGGV